MKRAFTLIELSIVLIIIGLLVGGILVGRDLIHAAKIQSVASEFRQYKTAINTFQIKYDALPGDMSNATVFWGESAATCSQTDSTGTTTTCDGNGDNIVATTEKFTFFKHLANAGLVAGDFSNISGPNHATTEFTPNFNVPKSAYADLAGWGVGNIKFAARTFDPYQTAPANINNMILGGWLINRLLIEPIFTGKDAYTIDTKIDDGKPGRGKIFVTASRLDYCTTAASNGNTETNADYDLASTFVGCMLLFVNAF